MTLKFLDIFQETIGFLEESRCLCVILRKNDKIMQLLRNFSQNHFSIG